MTLPQSAITALIMTCMLSACGSQHAEYITNRESSTNNSGAEEGPAERIISSIGNADISFNDMIKHLSSADYILLGERHDDPVHHRLQQRVLAALIESGRRPAVVFEMFDQEDAGLISATVRKHPHEPDHIANAVNWEASGWPAWQMYRPIVKTALDANLPIIAGNLSQWEARRMYLEGIPSVNAKTADYMGLMEPLPEEQLAQLRQKIGTYHGNLIPQEMFAGMLAAQRARDATLADSMISRNQGNGAVLIAGQEHTRTDYGVPFYLAHQEPGASIASLVFVDAIKAIDKSEAADWLHARQAYDFVWVLPSFEADEKLNAPNMAHQHN